MRIGENLEYKINVNNSQDDPVLILRQPTNAELKTFLRNRFARKGTRFDDKSIEAREQFIDNLLVGCKNVEVKGSPYITSEGTQSGWVNLNPEMPGWKNQIPLNWKTSVAMKFEEQEALSQDDEKNLEGVSV